MGISANRQIILFGGKNGWNASDWTASDDRVRGGSSQSYLDISGTTACFHGTLDTSTLGGAGFASQRTSTTELTWDLSKYDGVELELGSSDVKLYTFILKDRLLSPDPDTGRDQATVSYEFDFRVPGHIDEQKNKATPVKVPWSKFKPTYRGKPKEDAPALDTKNIRRFSIMMRSFFGDQEGNFSLNIKCIKAASFSEEA